MAAEKKCCVVNCGKTRETTILHAFPNPEKDLDRFNKWFNAIGGAILHLDRNYIFKYRKVCHIHFERRFWMASKRLSADSYPTLRLTGLYNCSPLGDITNHPGVIIDRVLPSTSADLYNCNTLGDITNYPQVSVECVLPSTSAGFPCDEEVVIDQPMDLNKGRPTLSEVISTDKSVRDLKIIIKQLKKKESSYAIRLKKAMKLSENKTFQNCLRKFSSLAALFTIMQFREVNKKKMGRRFTRDEKILALSLYKQGPKAYRWLRKIFILPAPVTLSRLISKASIKPGVNKNIFMQLKKKVKTLKKHDRLCILLFDEMAITPHFDYNRKNDLITGFVNNGSEKQKIIADHALVVMIRGVTKNFKQPVAYTFCAGSTSKDELKKMISQMINEIQKCGLKVVATVCDQATANVSAIHKLVNENRQNHIRNNREFKYNTFQVNGEEIVPLFDTPHLIKGIRNNLLTKNLVYVVDSEVKTAKWDHILKLYEENPEYKGIRLIKKLTESHVNPKKIPKMKVKYATQVFSRTVATNMGYLSGKGILPNECKNTADVLIFFDDLFDSFNGSYVNSKKRSGKDLLGPVTPLSKHRSVWNNAKKVISTMNFLTKEGKSANVPSISNWLYTIDNMMYLINKLKNDYEIKSVWMRHFNQDPLENFFGCIRSHGYRNNSPTPAGFEAAFTALLINNISSNHSPGSNCEVDSCSVFKSMNYLMKSTQKDDHGEVDFDDLNYECVDFHEKLADARIKAELNYVTGYLLRQAKRNVFKNCQNCQKDLFDKDQRNEYIRLREYHKEKKWLLYPNTELIKMFSNMQDICSMLIEKKSDLFHIKNYIKTILYIVINFDFIKCSLHRNKLIDFILDLGSRFFICTNWCRDVNKILNGTRTDFNNNDTVKLKCFDYFKKRSNKPCKS